MAHGAQGEWKQEIAAVESEITKLNLRRKYKNPTKNWVKNPI